MMENSQHDDFVSLRLVVVDDVLVHLDAVATRSVRVLLSNVEIRSESDSQLAGWTQPGFWSVERDAAGA